MNRTQWEAASIARRSGFTVAELVETRRKEERRQTAAAYEGEERRNEERRAMIDSAIVSNWTRAFDQARNIGSN